MRPGQARRVLRVRVDALGAAPDPGQDTEGAHPHPGHGRREARGDAGKKLYDAVAVTFYD